jgi:hypothetical protein
VPTIKHTEWYYSGNPDHADKKRIYLTDSRTLLKMLMNGKLHCFTVDQRAEFLGEPTEANEYRIKILCDKKQVYCDNMGLYRLG